MGFISSYFVTVKTNSKVIENPELSKKHPEYVGRVQWVGDVSKSYAAFRLVNVSLEDSNTYGCEVNLGFFADALDSTIILTVKVVTCCSCCCYFSFFFTFLCSQFLVMRHVRQIKATINHNLPQYPFLLYHMAIILNISDLPTILVVLSRCNFLPYVDTFIENMKYCS